MSALSTPLGRRRASARRSSLGRPTPQARGRDLQALLDAAGAHTPIGLRNRVLVALVCGCGLHPRDAVRVRAGDLGQEANGRSTPRIARGRPRIAVDRSTSELIAAWLELRRRWGVPDETELICTLAGRPLAGRTAADLLARLVTRAEVERTAGAWSGPMPLG